MNRLISAPQYNRLLDAPDDWEPMPPFSNQRATLALLKRVLIEVRGDRDVEWRITTAGLDMIRECIKAWQLQGEFQFDDTI